MKRQNVGSKDWNVAALEFSPAVLESRLVVVRVPRLVDQGFPPVADRELRHADRELDRELDQAVVLTQTHAKDRAVVRTQTHVSQIAKSVTKANLRRKLFALKQ
jgi:hypothetical protein